MIFTLALGAFAALALSWWGYQLAGVFYPCDWEGLLADSALGEGRYDALRGYLGQAGSFAVYDQGALVFASEDGFDRALTDGELECIPVYGALTQVGSYEQTDETGTSRTLARSSRRLEPKSWSPKASVRLSRWSEVRSRTSPS